MNKRTSIYVLALAVVLLGAGCAILPPNAGRSTNFSLFNLTLNTALYKSSAANAVAGESVVQKTRAQAIGDEQISLPISAVGTQEEGGDAVTLAGSNINVVPLRVNIAGWKSVAAGASAGMVVTQDTSVNADGATKIDVIP